MQYDNDIMSQQIDWACGKGWRLADGPATYPNWKGSKMNMTLSPTVGECFVVTVLRVCSLYEVTPGEFRKRQKLEVASGK